MRRLAIVVLVLAFSLLAAGCDANRWSLIGGADKLTGTRWTLRTLGDRPLLADTAISLSFDDGTLGGYAGCNAYGATYSVGRTSLSLGETSITLQACMDPPGVLEQEQRYMDLLRSVAAYRLADGRLDLLDSSGRSVLVYDAQEVFHGDPADLIGTEWRLASMDGEPPIADEIYSLEFVDGRKYQGLAGCRHFEGEYEAAEGDIQFVSTAMLELDCPGADDAYYLREGRFTDALTWARQWRIVDSELEIRTAAGSSLIFLSVE